VRTVTSRTRPQAPDPGSPDPASAEVTDVTTRLPAATVVVNSKGFTFPPLPGRTTAVPPAAAAQEPSAAVPTQRTASPAAASDGPAGRRTPDEPPVVTAPMPPAPAEEPDGEPTTTPVSPALAVKPDREPTTAAVSPAPAVEPDREPTTAPVSPALAVKPDREPTTAAVSAAPAVEPDREPTTAPVSPAPAGPDLDAADVAAADIGDEVDAELAAQAAPRPAESGEWRGIVLVTGTDTDVGKTVVTAAVTAAAQASGLRVAVVKPGQTGTSTGMPTDIEVITRLAAPATTLTLAEYPEPMAPLAAATVASMPPLELYDVVDAIRAEADKHDLVLVEGAGGLLVPMGVRPSGEAWTFADLATTLGVGTIVVARAGLGTLNHTALTLEALARRGVHAGVVLGAWPAEPELVHWANLSELVPHLVGALPDGAGAMDPGVFRRSAPGWLTPALFGVLDNWRVWADEVN
jgi:dethiobiotin synthetase